MLLGKCERFPNGPTKEKKIKLTNGRRNVGKYNESRFKKGNTVIRSIIGRYNLF